MRRVLDFLTRPAVILVFRLVLAVIFISAALPKIVDTAGFAEDIANYKILPLIMINVTAMVVPWLELISGLSLLNGYYMRSGAIIVLCLNVVFMAAAGSAMARGLDINCGCETIANTDGKVGWDLIAQDILWSLMALAVIFTRDKEA